ncbi:MAG: hypothetical protein H6741_17095 [Alphaproteobacteria bacterium]|nr:hypothetical protein [Alphaproteobacteria bacterium]MCB9794433.1 hypothetical protein [Alphaproteobacteria bacterium]
MSTLRQAGDTPRPLDAAQRITTLRLELLPLDFIVQWRRCSLTADYLAQVHAYHFSQREVAAEVLSGALNELVENLVKFSADKRRMAHIELSHFGELIRVSSMNVASRAHAESLADRLDRIAQEDPELLFLEQLEFTAVADQSASGLGLIGLKKDYGVRMGVRLDSVEGHEDLRAIWFTLDFDVDAIEQA